MAEGLFIATAGNDNARAHFNLSVAEAIDARLIAMLPPSLARQAAALDGAHYAWGARPTKRNAGTYNNLQVGDSVLFVWESRYRCRARVTAKAVLPDFARELWGVDEDSSLTWELAYFLSEPEELSAKVADAADYLSAGYQGFARIGPARVARIEHDFGTVDAFLAARLSLQPLSRPQPSPIRDTRALEFLTRKQLSRERGGSKIPSRRTVPLNPPKPSASQRMTMDLEEQRVARERRNVAHHQLVRALADAAGAAGLDFCCTEYADLMDPGVIFEMKSISNDEMDQVRAAIGQLYYYRFIHRSWPGYEHPKLYAVFDKAIQPELAAYLNEIGIGTIWRELGAFNAAQNVRRDLAWIF